MCARHCAEKERSSCSAESLRFLHLLSERKQAYPDAYGVGPDRTIDLQFVNITVVMPCVFMLFLSSKVFSFFFSVALSAKKEIDAEICLSSFRLL